jgi:hypothetical protein
MRGSDLLLVHSIARWKQDHPDVTVSTKLVSGDPDAVLVRPEDLITRLQPDSARQRRRCC